MREDTRKPNPFRGFRLEGEAADSFRAQIKDIKPSKEGQRTMREALELAKEYDSNGVVVFTIDRDKL